MAKGEFHRCNGKIGIIIEARINSSRLFGKVMKRLNGKALIEILVERISRLSAIDVVIIATSTNPLDDVIAEWAEKNDVICFRGSEFDVYDRVLRCAQFHNIDLIVEIMGDCPLIDPASILDVLTVYFETEADYASAALSKKYPVGTEAQAYSTQLLEYIQSLGLSDYDREHVTTKIYGRPDLFKVIPVEPPIDRHFTSCRFVVDTAEDFGRLESFAAEFRGDLCDATISDICSYFQTFDT